MATLHLTVLVSVYGFGGTERHTVDLLRRLLERNWSIELIESGQPLISERISHGSLRVKHTNLSTRSENPHELDQWRLLLEGAPHGAVLLIKPSFWSCSIPLARLLKSTFNRFVQLEHTVPVLPERWTWRVHFNRRPRTGYWWYKRQWNDALRLLLPDHVFTVSGFLKQRLEAYVRHETNRISAFPNGIDEQYFVRDPNAGLALRQRLGIPNDAFVFGCVGRLSPEKGIDLAVEAFRKLSVELPECWLLIVGDGPERASIAESIRGVNATLLGFLEDVRPAYSAIDCILIPSHHEGHWGGESHSLTACEAMACGCMLVAANHGALPHVIGPAGHLVTSRSLDEWTAAMAAIASMPKLTIDEHNSRARQRVLQHYRSKPNLDRLIEALEVYATSNHRRIA